MTERSDIAPNSNGWSRLSYTYHCGWVDWGHAIPDGPRGLIDQLRNQDPGKNMPPGELDIVFNGKPAFLIKYGQYMGWRSIRVGTPRHWIVKKGLTEQELLSVALAIFLSASLDFEAMQGTLPYSVFSGDSSFSAEDLVSNLIGFYAAAKGLDIQRVRSLCGEVSVAESYRIWDTHTPDGLSTYRNRSTSPVRFPTNEIPANANKPTFPTVLNSIPIAPKGVNWTTPVGRFIAPAAWRSGKTIEVNSSGAIQYKNYNGLIDRF